MSLNQEFSKFIREGELVAAGLVWIEARVSLNRKEWLPEFYKPIVGLDEVAILKVINEKLEKIEHVSSIGSNFCDDELLLLLTLRIEISLLSKLLWEMGSDEPLELSHRLVSIDENLLEIKRCNQRDFESSIQLLQSNWREVLNWFFDEPLIGEPHVWK